GASPRFRRGGTVETLRLSDPLPGLRALDSPLQGARMSDPLSDAAADYLNLGLSIIALSGKTPNVDIHRRGLHEPIVGPVDTPEDWALIYRVFRHPATTGVGIVIPYPYVVVDIDGEEGADQWLDLVGLQESMPVGDSWVA